MKITGCTVDVVDVSFEGVMSGRHVVLRLHTDDGLTGISYVSRVTPKNMRALVLLIEGMVEALSGEDPTLIEAIHKRLYSSALGAPLTGLELRAASAIDVACWDLAGKAADMPVWKLAGGYRNRMPVSANWNLMPGPAKDKVARHLEDVVARGFCAVKAPCGSGTARKSHRSCPFHPGMRRPGYQDHRRRQFPMGPAQCDSFRTRDGRPGFVLD